MSESQREPERTPIQEWLKQFESDYRSLRVRALEAAETTVTAAWGANYKTQRNMHEQVESSAVKDLESAIATLKLEGTSEDIEKMMKDAVKTLSDERVKFQAWKARSVEAYRRSAVGLSEFIDNPLINRDFERDVKIALAGWTKASWDDETGQVVIE